MGLFRATPSGLSRPFWVPLGDKSTDRLMTQDEGDWTALHATAKHGSEEMVQDIVIVVDEIHGRETRERVAFQKGAYHAIQCT